MKLTTKQKSAVVVLALCGAALALDRTLFAPNDAGAAPAPPAPPAAAAQSGGAASPASARPAAEAATARRTALAARLAAMVKDQAIDASNAPDAFVPSPAWQPVEPVSSGIEAELAAEEFRRRHTLSAVMALADRGACVVDGRSVQVGQSIDGYTLLAVQPRSATFENGAGVRVELSLTEPTPGGP
jgi:hypothetical protein